MGIDRTRRNLPPGPLGQNAAKQRKQNSFIRPNWSDEKRDGEKQLIAKVYFETNKSHLDLEALKVVDVISIFFSGRYDSRDRLRLVFVGYADVRGTEQYNSELSKKRAKTLLDAVDGKFKGRSSPAAFLPQLDYKGEAGAGADWAEDRRVDVFELSPWTDPGAKDRGGLEAVIFEHWYPFWGYWSPLKHLLVFYEKHVLEDLSVLRLTESDLSLIEGLLTRYKNKDERVRIENYVQHDGRLKVLRDEFFQLYRKEWPRARERCEAEWWEYRKGLPDNLGLPLHKWIGTKVGINVEDR